MREILFRGKRIDNGDWVAGAFVPHWGTIEAYSKTGYSESHIVHLDSTGQYTGLTDKNGQKIFEGDIVKIASGTHPQDYTMTVRFGQCGGVENTGRGVGYMGFYFAPADKYTRECMKYALRNDPIYFLNSASCEVVGNVYDEGENIGG